MKQLTPKEVTVAGVTFYITPFAAFYAANLSGEIMSLVAPILTGLLSLVATNEDGEFDLENVKAEDAIEKIAPQLSKLDGDALETLLRKLLINKGNISFEDPESGQKGKLTYDEVNEIFCQDIFDLYRLAWEVISLNYGSFFGKVPGLSGSQDTLTFQKR